ncbi:signal peptidase I [Viscerimonas tarda]
MNHTVKNTIQWLSIFVGAITLAIALRVFVLAIFSIPSDSMAPAIIPGDHILINKLTPGPRILKNLDLLEKTGHLDIWRPSVFSIERNDVLVFNFPWNRTIENLNVYYVKRCVAIPGDTFYIENGIYKVKNLIGALGNYKDQEKLSLMEDSEFTPVIYKCFPHDSIYSWNIKNFGPIYIPEKEETIKLDTLNVRLYRNIIEYETNKRIKIKDGSVFLKDSIIEVFKFPQNYYFMAGDYIFNSKDSRYWGLLPEDHIVGKAFVIYKSKDLQTDTYRWNRFFKSVE